MTKVISLAELVRSGTFGPIAVGSSSRLVREWLGEPDDFGKGMRKTVIWSYGQRRLQLSVENERVVLIGYYPRTGSELPNGNRVVHDLPAGATDSDQRFMHWLEEAGLRFDVSSDETGIYLLRVKGGASVAFDEGHLDSVQAP